MLVTALRRVVPAAVLGAAAALGLAAPGVAAPQQEDSRAAFLQGWKQAEEVGDVAAQEKLLRRYKEDAIPLFVERAAAYADDPDQVDLGAWLDRFTEVWTRAFKTGFPRNYTRYLAFADRERLDIRRKALGELGQVNRLHLDALDGKDVDLVVARERADALVTSMESCGDLFYLAFAANIQGNLWNPAFFEEGADGRKALAAYQKCLDARKKLGLTNDAFYASTERVWKELRFRLGIVEEGEEEEAKAALARPEDLKPAEGVEWTSAALAPGFVKRDKVVHSCDLDHPDFHTWKRAAFGAPEDQNGKPAAMPGFGPPISILRVGPDKFQLLGGGEPSETFRLGSKPTVVEVPRKLTDGSIRPYWVEVVTGTQSDMFQGVQMNLAPTENSGTVYYRSPAEVRAETPFGPIAVRDLNADGHFGAEEPGLDWAEGLLPDTFYYRPDAIVFGKVKHSWPFSRFVADADGQWYELAMDSHAAPTEIRLIPVSGKRGELTVSWKGIKKLKLASLLLKSESRPTKGLVVDLAVWKGPKYELPVSQYSFLQARFRDAKGNEVLVLPPTATPVLVDVKEGASAELEFGAPFRLVTKASLDGKELTVSGRDLHVVGKAGERYLRMIGAPLYGVEVSGKGFKGEQLRAPTTEEAGADWERLYYPMDLAVELKKPASAMEVELTLKKHPWFGKLTGTIQAK